MNKNILFTASAIIAGAAVAFGATALTFAQAPANGAGTPPAPWGAMRGGALTEDRRDAFTGWYEQMEAHHDAMLAAMSAGDFEAWRAALPDNAPMADVITPENFDRFVEMHTLMNEAHAIAEELGLPGGKGFGGMMMGGHGMHHGMMGGFAAQNSATTQ